RLVHFGSRRLLWSATLLRNPRLPTLASRAVCLHGEILPPFPDPLLASMGETIVSPIEELALRL
ncbi:MAG: hypothetical protein AAB650_01920, partial [Patescibacteria group bacterium]